MPDVLPYGVCKVSERHTHAECRLTVYHVLAYFWLVSIQVLESIQRVFSRLVQMTDSSHSFAARFGIADDSSSCIYCTCSNPNKILLDFVCFRGNVSRLPPIECKPLIRLKSVHTRIRTQRLSSDSEATGC